MSRLRIAVQCDDAEAAQRLVACLEFVGETAIRTVHGEALPSDVGALFTDAAAPPQVGVPAVKIVAGGDAIAADGFVGVLRLPLQLNGLFAALHAATQFREQQTYDWPAADKETLRFGRLVGLSAAMASVRELLGKVARRDVTVLITGECGTGKATIARALHDASHRADGPFVPLNCAAMAAELLESELFGHEKGAFAGALAARPGRLELAQGGTLYLEEIGELSLRAQARLLRVLQERSFERVGGHATLKANVRLVAAASIELDERVRAGAFRDDLYYRLNVFPIAVPPLRRRLEDIPMLVAALCTDVEARLGASVRFDPAAFAALCGHDWPGNVRELANLVERMALAHPDGLVGVDDLPARFAPGTGAAAPVDANSVAARTQADALIDPDQPPSLPVNGIDLKDYLNRLERSLIRQALDDTDSVVARAADRLHIRRTTLVEKMRKYGLQRSDTV